MHPHVSPHRTKPFLLSLTRHESSAPSYLELLQGRVEMVGEPPTSSRRVHRRRLLPTDGVNAPAERWKRPALGVLAIVTRLLLLLFAAVAPQSVCAGQGLYRHFFPEACTTEVDPGADQIVVTGHIRLHGNVPDGVYSTTALVYTADGLYNYKQFAWSVADGIATPDPNFPLTGPIVNVQAYAAPGFVIPWYNIVQTLPGGFAGDANGFQPPVGFYVGDPIDKCDGQAGFDYPAGFYWDVYATPEVPPDENQTKQCDANTGCSNCSPKGIATYWFHLMLASLHIEDTPISYNSPRGPTPEFKVVYNQREANQPASFSYSNLGPKWTFNWLSYVTDDGGSAPYPNPSVYVKNSCAVNCCETFVKKGLTRAAGTENKRATPFPHDRCSLRSSPCALSSGPSDLF